MENNYKHYHIHMSTKHQSSLYRFVKKNYELSYFRILFCSYLDHSFVKKNNMSSYILNIFACLNDEKIINGLKTVGNHPKHSGLKVGKKMCFRLVPQLPT